jgi:hypothetical protein
LRRNIMRRREGILDDRRRVAVGIFRHIVREDLATPRARTGAAADPATD